VFANMGAFMFTEKREYFSNRSPVASTGDDVFIDAAYS
jgi:hypothetical protein